MTYTAKGGRNKGGLSGRMGGGRGEYVIFLLIV